MNIICQSLYYQYILDKFHFFKSPKTFRVIITIILCCPCYMPKYVPSYLNDVTLFSAPLISIVMTPTIVLYECIVQRRYLFFAKLCFDNIISIIMKVSYMKSNTYIYNTYLHFYVFPYFC
jgi:hypothetical protein